MQTHGNINGDEHEYTEYQERMRRNLRYHFMNPKEKWQAKGTLPIKMILIIFKLIILTFQVIFFSQNNSNEVSFIEGSKTSFKHLFLEHWESSYETLPYPPSTGPFAIYKIAEFYSAAEFALENYYKLNEEAIGPYGYGKTNKPDMVLCVTYYKISEIFPYNSSYRFTDEVTESCIDLKPISYPNNSIYSYNVKDILQQNNFTINFNGLTKAEIKFTLRSIQLKSYEIDKIPDCFEFQLIIIFDNNNHNGQLLVDLKVSMIELECYMLSEPSQKDYVTIILKVVDYLALISSVFSFMLCCRSNFRLYKFWKKVKSFYLNEMGVDISNKRKYFVSISYILMFFGDILVICGIIAKLKTDSSAGKKAIASVTITNYFLGIGVFLGYLTLLRYFTFYRKSSVLINTIKAATSPLLRFSLCSIILYLAFSLLGWIILGPYHLKFRNFFNSVACLFSLMNGDDMYVTLSIIGENNTAVFVFSQLFIYLFCLLFIFVVLNLILTIIIEAYNDVQHQDLSSTQLDNFWGFINACQESSKSPLYRSDMIFDKSLRKQKSANFSRKFVDTFCCCIGKGSHTQEIKENNDEIDDDDDDDDNDNNFRSMPQYLEQDDDNQCLVNRTNNLRDNYGAFHSTHHRSPTCHETPDDNRDHVLSC